MKSLLNSVVKIVNKSVKRMENGVNHELDSLIFSIKSFNMLISLSSVISIDPISCYYKPSLHIYFLAVVLFLSFYLPSSMKKFIHICRVLVLILLTI